MIGCVVLVLLLPSDMFEDITGEQYLYNIVAIDNLPSILNCGILSHNDALDIEHISIAMEEIQERRDDVAVVDGMRLHDYANLYFCPKNPMLYKRKEMRTSLCVLVVSDEVLNVDGCIVTDQNAATDWVRFYEPIGGLQEINFNMVYEENWNHMDAVEKRHHKAIKCAEVLIPHCIKPDYILEVAVVNEFVKRKVLDICPNINVTVEPDLFF